MGRGYEEEKKFAESLDRLLSGQSAPDETEPDGDLRSALNFAQRMSALRPEPSPQFRSHLKVTLLEKLNEQESEGRRGWFWRLVPHEPVWQAVSVMVIMLVVGGVLWSTLFRPGGTGNPPIVNVPTITQPAMTTTAAPVTKPAATTTAAPTTAPATTAAPATATTPASTTTAPTVAPGTYFAVVAGTDKGAYRTGEKVNIEISLKNVTSGALTLDKYPPILSLMQASDSQPVYTFAPERSLRTINPGETATFVMTWDQIDAQGRTVSPGTYYIELEDIDYQGLTLKMNLSQPVSFQIIY